MSREIDMTNPDAWDEDDILHLAQRGLLPTAVLDRPEVRKALQATELPLEDRANTGDVNSDGVTKEEHAAVVEALAAAQAENDALRAKNLPKPQSIVGEYGDGWTNDTRRTEMEKRGLDPSGMNKDELIEALQENDREGGAVDDDDSDEDEEND